MRGKRNSELRNFQNVSLERGNCRREKRVHSHEERPGLGQRAPESSWRAPPFPVPRARVASGFKIFAYRQNAAVPPPSAVRAHVQPSTNMKKLSQHTIMFAGQYVRYSIPKNQGPTTLRVVGGHKQRYIRPFSHERPHASSHANERTYTTVLTAVVFAHSVHFIFAYFIAEKLLSQRFGPLSVGRCIGCACSYYCTRCSPQPSEADELRHEEKLRNH